MPFILVPLFHHSGAGWLFTVVAAAMAIVAATIYVFGPLTTGRTLTDVNIFGGQGY